MDQISLALRGGLAPISLPWFHGAVVRQGWSEIMSCIAVLLKQSPTMNLGRSADETQTGHSSESSSAYQGKSDVPFCAPIYSS